MVDLNYSVVVQIPPGTLCTGGKAERMCLLAFTTAGGYGNCVVITQPSGTAVGPTNPAAAVGCAPTRHNFIHLLPDSISLPSPLTRK